MQLPTRQELEKILKDARVSKRLVRDIRYVPEEITHADIRDFMPVTTKSGNEGVLLFGDKIIQFTLDKRRPNAAGRVEAIICDICATWQRGTNSAILTFKVSAVHTISHLVCADLDCSLHVRGLTNASKLARTQIREQITPEGRIERLHDRLAAIAEEV